MLSSLIQIEQAVGTLVNLAIPILIGIAIVVFFWGLVKYIWGAGKDTGAGRKIMLAGLISFFIMVSLYGIINFAGNAIGINTNGVGNGARPNAPAIPPQI